MVIILLIFLVVAFFWYAEYESRKFKSMTQEEKLAYGKQQQESINRARYGVKNSFMKCPHCETVGKVRTKSIKVKKGISGTKAAAAVITAGSSVIATGLSRKENLTQAYCEHCGNTWSF